MEINRRFPQKRVFITGAASGLGRALATAFAKKGWRIAVADIHGERAQETLELVRQNGGVGQFILCDVTRPDNLEEAALGVKREWGGVDILINNAGVAAAGYFEKIELKTWDWIIDVNLKGVIYGCRAFIPLLKEQGRGYIVNVASSSGIASFPEMACYNVTKAAVISLSETLRTELSLCGVGVSAACPTFFKTNLMENFTSTDPRQRRLSEGFFNKSKSSAEEVAADIIRAIQSNRFYVITQSEGRVVWRLKRYFPEGYFKLTSFVYRKGYIEKALGVTAA